jgi:hypothetical protein
LQSGFTLLPDFINVGLMPGGMSLKTPISTNLEGGNISHLGNTPAKNSRALEEILGLIGSRGNGMIQSIN